MAVSVHHDNIDSTGLYSRKQWHTYIPELTSVQAYIMVSIAPAGEEGDLWSAGERLMRELKLRSHKVLGPYDVVVEAQADDVYKLDEHIITKIEQLPMITATVTYVACGESRAKNVNAETGAYMLIDAIPGLSLMERIQDELFKREEIQRADIVFGPFDLIASTTLKSTKELGELYDEMRKIPGVKRIMPMPVMETQKNI